MARIKKSEEPKKKPQGTYFAGRSSNVVRTVPVGEFGGKPMVRTKSIDTAGYSKGKKNFTLKSNVIGDKPETKVPRDKVLSTISDLRKGATRIEEYKPSKKQKNGGKTMLKRADGSVSQRGLWDNIRAAAKRNKAAGKPGKKPTAAMLKQERKIKAKSK